MMRILLMAMAILLSSTGCATAVPVQGPDVQPSDVQSPTVQSPDAESPGVAAAGARDPAPAGLLVDVRAAAHPGYERLVFEFGGDKAPPHRIRVVNEVRQDPSDKLIPLRGKRFLVVVFDGGTLDTLPRESDPAKARRYTGPQRITPDLALLKEVAVAGDFEAVLSFGIGLSGPAETVVERLSSPARLVIDLRGQ